METTPSVAGATTWRRDRLPAYAANQFGLVAKHTEETIQFGLDAGPVATEEPADERDAIEHPPTAEMPCIGDMACAQFSAMEIRDELIQYRVNLVHIVK